MPGSIITFYSYKGGAGRTMALANTACLLAATGHRVLAIDWDLEAPGLHRFLHPFLSDPELSKTLGIIDLIWDYAAAAARPGSTDRREFDPLTLADPGHVATTTSLPMKGPDASGCLHMIGAGKQNSVYADRVRSFDWAAMFSHLEGAAFIRRFGENCRTAYDFTLIDSRTGIADTAGIATILLPDRVVLCFTPNRQSVLGIRAIGESIMAARPLLRLLPVVTRVEKGVEGWREAQIFYRFQLDHLLPPAATDATRAAYWGSAEIVHYPNYALGELLATFCDSPTERNSLLSDMCLLVSRTIENEFMSLGDNFAAPEFSKLARRHYLRRVQFRDPRIAELQAALDGDAPSALAAVSSFAAGAWREDDPDPEWLKQSASTLNTLSVRLSSLGRREEALALSQEAVSTYRRLAQMQPAAFMPDLAESLANLANRLSEVSRLEDALAPAEEAIRLYDALAEACPDEFTSNLAGSLANLALLLRAQGNLAGARPLMERVLAMRERSLGTEDPDTALSLNYLGMLLQSQGDYAGARPLYERALAIREKKLGAEHPSTATSLNNLATLLQAEGNYAGARPLLERALAIAEKALGAEHPDTATSLNNLANLLQAEGNYAGARPLLERALTIRENALGTLHPDTATSLNRLASLLHDQKDYSGARPLMERALAIYEKALGPEHPSMATSVNNLALLLMDQGDLAGARPLFERALAIREKALGPEHPDTATSLNNLALLLKAQGDLAGARPLFERALAIYEKVLGPEHPNTNRARCNFASLLVSGNPAEALTFGHTALAAHEQALGPNHPWTKDSARITADALVALGRAGEAEALRARYGLEHDTCPQEGRAG